MGIGGCMKSVLRRSESIFDVLNRSKSLFDLAVLPLFDFQADFLFAYLFWVQIITLDNLEEALDTNESFLFVFAGDDENSDFGCLTSEAIVYESVNLTRVNYMLSPN